jgi:uncharacterized protein (UPF0548 family)
MLSVRRPSSSTIHAFLARQSQLDFTYAAVGATATTPPAGYIVDHTRIRLGEGEEIFIKAMAALRHWDQFRLGWVETYPPDAPIEPGAVVAIVARSFGLWWINACRIVYVIEESGATSRFGFAYGTLPDHAGSGEERFLVEWDRTSQAVWYDVFAFSRPRQIQVRLGYRFMRRLQKSFGKSSAAALALAIA